MPATPGWIIAAAHELGHVAGFQAIALPMAEVRLTAKRGWVRVETADENAALADPERARGYLVGIAAGRAAQVRMSEEHGVTPYSESWASDLVLIAQLRRRHPALASLTPAVLASAADALVRSRWSWIARNAHQLARRGHFSP
jgi:hypothetical protein